MTERFNPFGCYIGLFIPNAISQCPDLSAAAKLVYGRLCQYAGRNGEAFPKQTTLADEVGLQRRRVQQVLEELETFGLIESSVPKGAKKLMHATNRYYFLEHKILKDSTKLAPPGAHPSAHGGAHSSAPPIEEIQYKREEERQSAVADTAPSLGTNSPNGQTSHAFQKLFIKYWERKYPNQKYFFVGKKDGPNIKRMFGHLRGDEVAWKKVVKRYLADDDPFYAGHTISNLVAQLPKFLVDTPAKSKSERGNDARKKYFKIYEDTKRHHRDIDGNTVFQKWWFDADGEVVEVIDYVDKDGNKVKQGPDAEYD
jgi:hypothetical protein